jgi:hypothetical protein
MKIEVLLDPDLKLLDDRLWARVVFHHLLRLLLLPAVVEDVLSHGGTLEFP